MLPIVIEKVPEHVVSVNFLFNDVWKLIENSVIFLRLNGHICIILPFVVKKLLNSLMLLWININTSVKMLNKP